MRFHRVASPAVAWDDPLAAIDVDGPVLVEVFVLFVVDPLLVEAMDLPEPSRNLG